MYLVSGWSNKMEVYIFDGLICTDVIITFHGKTKVLKNVVIDTGAVQSIINSALVEDIGIIPNISDKPVKTRGIGGEMKFFYRKVDKIAIGDISLKNMIIDFGDIDPNGEIAGLIGLDILRELKAVIDVEIPVIYTKK